MGFLNQYKFDEGGVLQGYQDKGFVSKVTLEAEKSKTISQALDKMLTAMPTQKETYTIARKQMEVIFREVYPDIAKVLKEGENILDKIQLRNVSWNDTAKFLQIADKKNYGEGTLKTLGSMYKYVPDSTNHYSKIFKDKVLFNQLYTKKLTMKGTPVPIWDEAAEQSYKNLLEWIDDERTISSKKTKSRRIEYKGLNPNHIGTVKGSINRLAKIQLLTGLRTIDIVRLRPEDISQDGFIRYLSAKGAAKGQPLPISDEALKLLNEQLAAVNKVEGGSIEKIAKAYEGAWNGQINRAIKNKRLNINIKTATGGEERLLIKYARKYHASKLKQIGFGSAADANKILGWSDDTTEGAAKTSKMLDEVYAKTTGEKLVVNLQDTETGHQRLKNIVNKKQIKIAETTGYKFTTTPVIDKQKKLAVDQDIVQDQKSKSLGQQVDELKKPVVTVSGTGATVNVSKEDTEKVKSKERNWIEKTKSTRKVLSKAALLSILSKITKAAGLIIPAEPIQAISQVAGGEEGILPTTESRNILGFIPPTITKEAEAWTDIFGIPTYPEGHEKEGQHILSTKEYEQMQMPEELEQFEQQGRL